MKLKTEPLELAGCTPEPLQGYLKALGVFRLLAEQADRAASMSWAGGVCTLYSSLDRAGVVDFFLNRYRPTPVLAPWNGGSGFYSGGAEPLDAIARSRTARLAAYRETVNVVRGLIPRNKPKDDEKESLLIRCRAELSDEVVPWLDTCFALGEDGPSFFPLLGTGGNDGRLDFTNNFFQRLADVIPFEDDASLPAGSAGWLASALFGDDPDLTAYRKAAVGQFNPGGVGGPNGVQGDFEAGSRVNPWEFVLAIEGGLLFAGSVARRLGTNAPPRAVFPFTVESVAVGYGTAGANEETSDGSRAELWLPLWAEPAGLPEVRQLFAEGRAQVGRRQARNSVEFALAACLLGVNRGVRSFARYGFLKRNGLAFLATPLGRVAVTPRPAARLLEDPPLTEWLDRLRSACRDKDKTPARYQAALRQIDRAVYAFSTQAQTDPTADRRGLLDVLRAVGCAERVLSNGLAFCKDKHLRPLQGLSPQWLDQVETCAELRLAASLAGVRGRGPVGPLRLFVEKVELTGRFYNWSAGSTSAVWSNRGLAENLAAVFRRRQMEAFRAGQVGLPLYSPRPAPLEDVLAFLNGATDDELLHDLLWGLCALEWSGLHPRTQERGPGGDVEPPFEFGVPRLLVEPVRLAPVGGQWRIDDGGEATVPDPDVFHLLSTAAPDAVRRCVDRAARRLKSGGRLVIGYRDRRRSGKSLAIASPVRPVRLLASLLFPLSFADLGAIAEAVLYRPEAQE